VPEARCARRLKKIIPQERSAIVRDGACTQLRLVYFRQFLSEYCRSGHHPCV
jgi:hypothetical protein